MDNISYTPDPQENEEMTVFLTHLLEGFEERITDETIQKIGKLIMEDESRTSILNLPRVQQMNFCYKALKAFALGKDVKITCKENEPFHSMGSVTAEGAVILFDNTEWFARIAEFASNTDIYPLTADRVRITFTFHGITRPIE